MFASSLEVCNVEGIPDTLSSLTFASSLEVCNVEEVPGTVS